MRRTEPRQEVRKMRFEEACGGWRERRLTQEEAARMPGGVRAYSLSPQKRGFRRSVDRYEEEEGWTVWWTSAWGRCRRIGHRSMRWGGSPTHAI